MGLWGPDLGMGGRFTATILGTPHMGLRVGALGFLSDTLLAAGGTAGLYLPLTTGRFRLTLCAEGMGGGEARQSAYDTLTFQGPGGQRTIVLYEDTVQAALAALAGLELHAILGPGLSLDVGGGVLQWLHRKERPAPVPLVSVGLGWSFRNQRWFMRRHDERPPRLVLLTPAAPPDTAVRVATRRVAVEGVVASWAGIDEVSVQGRRVRLLDEGATRRQAPADLEIEGPARLFRTELDLPPAGVTTIEVAARDGRGRTTSTQLTLAAPADSAGPVMALSFGALERDPESGVVTLPAERDSIRLAGLLLDAAGVESVHVNETPVVLALAEATRNAAPEERRYAFALDLGVPEGETTLTVVARDSLGQETTRSVQLFRPVAAVATDVERPADVAGAPGAAGAVPDIEVLEPREWRGGGLRGLAIAAKNSVQVDGRVRYEPGLDEVLINGVRAALAPEPGGVSWRFSGFAAVTEDTREVEITAMGMDGGLASRIYAVRPMAAAPAVAGLRGQRWAVVVGVSEYQDTQIPDLRYADDDARAMYSFLRSEAAGLGGIPDSNIRLLVDEDATFRNIRSALLTFLQSSTPEDLIFVYIAGHGAPNPRRPDDLYILAYDTELDDIAATAVPMAEVADAISKAYARNKVLFTDACHSAGIGGAAARALSLNQINAYFLESMAMSSGGFVSFTASEVNQLSQEGRQWGDHGVFTYFLLEGLRGDADADGDYIVTLGELMEFTRDRVRRETRNDQIPTISQTSFDRFWPMAIVPDGR